MDHWIQSGAILILNAGGFEGLWWCVDTRKAVAHPTAAYISTDVRKMLQFINDVFVGEDHQEFPEGLHWRERRERPVRLPRLT